MQVTISFLVHECRTVVIKMPVRNIITEQKDEIDVQRVEMQGEEKKTDKENDNDHRFVKQEDTLRCGTHQATTTRVDPVKYLRRKALAYVFSFVGIPAQKECDYATAGMVCFLEAGKTYACLSAVSRSWKEAMDVGLFDSILQAPLHVDFDRLHRKDILSCIVWFCVHKLSIGALAFESYQSDYPILSSMLQQCNTKNLTSVRAHCHVHKSPHWVLEGSPSYEYFRKCELNHRDFQDVLSLHCPNITELAIRLAVRGDGGEEDFEGISAHLFSSPSIRCLELRFALPMIYGEDIKDSFFSELIRNLKGLEHLTLIDDSEMVFRCRNSDISRVQHFRIESKSLKFLDVTNYRHRVSFTCDCPELLIFRCKGDVCPRRGDLKVFQKMLPQSRTPSLRRVSLLNISARSRREEIEALSVHEIGRAEFWESFPPLRYY